MLEYNLGKRIDFLNINKVGKWNIFVKTSALVYSKTQIYSNFFKNNFSFL